MQRKINAVRKEGRKDESYKACYKKGKMDTGKHLQETMQERYGNGLHKAIIHADHY